MDHLGPGALSSGAGERKFCHRQGVKRSWDGDDPTFHSLVKFLPSLHTHPHAQHLPCAHTRVCPQPHKRASQALHDFLVTPEVGLAYWCLYALLLWLRLFPLIVSKVSLIAVSRTPRVLLVTERVCMLQCCTMFMLASLPTPCSACTGSHCPCCRHVTWPSFVLALRHGLCTHLPTLPRGVNHVFSLYKTSMCINVPDTYRQLVDIC